MEVPLVQLTSIFLNCPLTVDDCLVILKRGSQLETVEFNNIFRESDQPQDTTPGHVIPHHMVSSLKIHSSVDVGQLFHDMEFSNLTHLHLDLPHTANRLNDLKIPWPLLTTLILTCPLDLVEAYQVFRRCHLVARIEWNWPSEMGNSFPLNGLPSGNQPPFTLPHLQSLSITPSVPGSYVEPLLRLMAKSLRGLYHLTLPSLPRKILPSIFSRLSTLALTSTPITIPECLSIIARSPCLSKLDVVVRGGDDSANTSDDKILVTNYHLTAFTVRTMLKNLQPLFNVLVLPSLSSLEISSQPDERGPNPLNSELDWTRTKDYTYGPEQQGLQDFISRQSGSDGVPTFLQRLTLQNLDIEEKELNYIRDRAVSFETEVNFISIRSVNRNTKISKSLDLFQKYVY